MKFLKWFYLGMGIKRWIFLCLAGVLIFSIGILLCFNGPVNHLIDTLLAYGISLKVSKGIPLHFFFALFLVVGVFLIMIGIWGWMRSILTAVKPENENSLVDILYQQRNLKKGLKVVVIGGGTGLSTLLRGLKEYTSNIVAVVTVSDDGGSSGRLRKELGVLPPGDIRNCIAALADSELLGELLQYRFEEGNGLEGHSFGNLFLVAMTGTTGDFLQGIKESSRVLAIRGTVLPSTLDTVTLCAELDDGTLIEGESKIGEKQRPIRRIFLKPRSPKPVDEVIQAIKEADAIVYGPGSLYTSIMPNLLIGKMVEAIQNSPAIKIFVCNCMTQPGETSGFTASQHLEVFVQQFGEKLVEYALINTLVPSPAMNAKYEEKGGGFVLPDQDKIEKMGIKPIALPLINETDLIRHDPKKLALSLIKVIMEGLYRSPGKQEVQLLEPSKL
jgi:uncharacterized cofD-like protein